MSIDKLGSKWIKVDLDHFEYNLNWIRNRVQPAAVMPVIKANAYGHGAVKIAQVCERMGFKWLVVASLREALELRRHYVQARILVLGVTSVAQIPDLINYRITPTVCDVDYARALEMQAKRLGQTIAIHVYVDTGMGRMGQLPDGMREMVAVLKDCAHLVWEGLYSHYAVSDESDAESRAFTVLQWQRLLKCAGELTEINPMLHMSNSGAVLTHLEGKADAVRPGLICYGISPCAMATELKPVMSLHCRPLFFKRMKAGESVGYGRVFKLKQDTNILTLPVGYADGVPRRLGSNLSVSIKGKLYPIVGRICMDMMMVDLGETTVGQQTEITLMGGQGPSVETWAKWSDTIPYEIFTSLGRRWSYIYCRGEKIEDMQLSEA